MLEGFLLETRNIVVTVYGLKEIYKISSVIHAFLNDELIVHAIKLETERAGI